MIYPTLLDRYEDRGDVFDVAQYVWGDGEKPSGVRYGSQAGLSATDLYQLYTYTRRYGVRRCVLLFLSVFEVRNRDFARLSASGEPDVTAIALRYLNIHRNLRRGTEFRNLVNYLALLLHGNLQQPIDPIEEPERYQ